MAVNPNEDTEFNDALRAHGILPPKPKEPSSDDDEASLRPTPSEARHARLSAAPLSSLEAELDELDGDSDEENKILLSYRRKRMEEMMRARKREKFGSVLPISRADYTREVTEASKVDPDAEDREREEEGGEAGEEKENRKGTGVVCFLYKDSIPECTLLGKYLEQLASLYLSTKFVSIIGDQCIENYPDRNLPTLLIYRNGDLLTQVVGLGSQYGLRGMETTLQDVESLLLLTGALLPPNPSDPAYPTNRPSNLPAPPALQVFVPGPGGGPSSASATFHSASAGSRDEGSDEESDEGFGGRRRKVDRSIRSGTGTGTGAAGGRQARVGEGDDDDLDWDL